MRAALLVVAVLGTSLAPSVAEAQERSSAGGASEQAVLAEPLPTTRDTPKVTVLASYGLGASPWAVELQYALGLEAGVAVTNRLRLGGSLHFYTSEYGWADSCHHDQSKDCFEPGTAVGSLFGELSQPLLSGRLLPRGAFYLGLGHGLFGRVPISAFVRAELGLDVALGPFLLGAAGWGTADSGRNPPSLGVGLRGGFMYWGR